MTEDRKYPTLFESIGVYLPSKAVSTKEVMAGCRNRLLFPLEQVTGISRRHQAGEFEFSIDLASKAMAICFYRSRIAASDIELLVCCNISRVDGPEHAFTFEPSTSLRLSKQFGCQQAITFDVSNGCAGLFTGILIADTFINQGLVKNAMVVSGEYITHLTDAAQKEIRNDMDPRLACLTLGDSGAAIILERSSDPDYGFSEIDLQTLGRYSSLCVAKLSDRPQNGGIMLTDALQMSSASIRHGVAHAVETLRRAQLPLAAFRHIFAHQTSRSSLKGAAHEINNYFGAGVRSEEKLADNLANCGNTATTTQIVALWKYLLEGKVCTGDRVVFSCTGSGLTVGTALYRFDDLPERLQNPEQRSAPVRRSPNTSRSALTSAAVSRIRIEAVGIAWPAAQREPNGIAMACDAVSECLSRSNYTADDIDLLICCGVYRNEFLAEPALAAVIAGKMGMGLNGRNILAFDVLNGATGFLNACQVGSEMIRSGKRRSVMIVAAEIENNGSDGNLLGLAEMASAVILDGGGGDRGFERFHFEMYPEQSDAVFTRLAIHDNRGVLHIERKPDWEERYRHCIRATIRKLLETGSFDPSKCRLALVPHLSPAFVSELSGLLDLPPDLIAGGSGFGDLFTSFVPYTVRSAAPFGVTASKASALIVTAGSGVQIGCAIYHL